VYDDGVSHFECVPSDVVWALPPVSRIKPSSSSSSPLRTHTIILHARIYAVNKQINDKERACAAMENPELRAIVEECLKDMEIG
jgi:hypothetical protein